MSRSSGARPNKNWKAGLILGSLDKPKPILANALQALRHAPELSDTLRFNELKLCTEVHGALPWYADKQCAGRAWTDNDDRLLAEWLQRNGICLKAAEAAGAAETVAREFPYHPVQAYLGGLKWDGAHRIDQWLTKYLGVPDCLYAQAVGRKWLISAVARVYEPGCKADAVLVLEGDQGRGKSTALSILAGDWFADRLSDVRGKDAAEELSGVWIVEIAELHSVAKADASAIKAFLSRTADRFRLPYARRSSTILRQCVFAATVNPEGGYLKDPTGGRRFWPVTCTAIALPPLREDRDQLWAEAVHAYQGRESWWLDSDEELLAGMEQSQRYQSDPWHAPILAYVADKDEVSIPKLLQELGVDTGHQTNSHQTRASRVLVAIGFEKCRANHGAGLRPWVYRRRPELTCPKSPTAPS